ncbi:hypothetical protein GS397_26895 (plasmid) [Sphingobium yanoikuyae]|uniref:Oligosaccharide repeat unit polymerase n=1 Tax=Sphingobium yanoikuyae TaxID=13690 RepID=A0A6P1GQ67_SPHYA|nr:hypothetical protein [Sphingobium yanoikuyae]QHD70735.1 hypothetical protein GS397_26895 [Sphingobium yanoikuyae]
MTHAARIAAPALLPIFRYWVIGLVLLVAISPTDIPASYRLYLFLVYGLLFFYPVVSRRHDNLSMARSIQYSPINLRSAVVLAAIQIAAVAIATQFYTGSSVFSAFSATLAGENTYAAYQSYFNEAQFSAQSPVTRLVYIVLLALAKVIFVFSVLNFFLGLKRSFYSAAFMAGCCIFYIGFGLSRGTFFEVFEVACAIFYFWYMTSVIANEREVKRSKAVLYTALIGSVTLVALFFINVARRYGDSFVIKSCTQNFCYEPFGLGDRLEHPIYLLTGYFGNGGYFISALFDTMFEHGEAAFLIPMQSVFNNLGSDEFGVRAFMCEKHVSCQFVWTPEIATLISTFGIFTILVSNMLVTYLGKLEASIIRNFSVVGMLLLYFAFIFVISLPSANFFTTSGPSILATLFLSALFVWQRLRPQIMEGLILQ